jgi:hypothetical protein
MEMEIELAKLRKTRLVVLSDLMFTTASRVAFMGLFEESGSLEHGGTALKRASSEDGIYLVGNSEYISKHLQL